MGSMLEHMYEACCSGEWAHPNTSICACNGKGWMLSDLDTWHKCPLHGEGVPHPEDYQSEDDVVTGETVNHYAGNAVCDGCRHKRQCDSYNTTRSVEDKICVLYEPVQLEDDDIPF